MIRNYEHGDHEEIAKIFPEAIHQIASEYYTEEQCLAWSEKEPNPLHWEKRCAKKKPFVYLIKGAVVGFIELDPDGHIDCLYVHPNAKRKGIASALIQHVLGVCNEQRIETIYVEASLCARPVFEKIGFKVVEKQEIMIKEETLINYRMERSNKKD